MNEQLKICIVVFFG